MWVLSAELTAQAVNIASPMTCTNVTSSKEAMFHQTSMRDVKVAHEAKCSNVTPYKEVTFDQASMLLCDCFVPANARDLQLDSELLRLFIRSIQVSVLAGFCMCQNANKDVDDLESMCINTQTLWKMGMRSFAVTVGQRCMRSYSATVAQIRRVDRGAVEDQSVANKSD